MTDILRGARSFAVPTDGPLDIVVQDGVIQAVGAAGSASDGRVVDLDGLEIMPGAIDAHVHPVHDETFGSVGRAAVFGGVTTVCNQLYPAPSESFPDAIGRMIRESEEATADFAAHVRWDRTRSSSDVQAGADAGAISIKVFLAHPDKSVQSGLGDLVGAMAAAGRAGLPTLVHAELGDVVDRTLELGLADASTLTEVAQWRTPANEAAAVHAASVVSRATRAPLYVVHTSCEEALFECMAARERSTPLFVETCPHYLFLDQDSAPPGGQGFVLPPLRESSDRAALRRALAEGWVDTVGSDHCGHGRSAKPVAHVTGAKAGLPGIEALLPLLLHAALGEDAWLPRRRVVDVLCENPARIFGLGGKGRIAAGYDADLVLVDPAGTSTIRKSDLHDAADYSPYEGWSLHGAVHQVWRRGTMVVADGEAQEQGGGRFVPRA